MSDTSATDGINLIGRRARVSDGRHLLWSLILLLVLAPLPLGSNRPVPWTALAIATAALLLAWSAHAGARPAGVVTAPERLWPAVAGFELALLVIIAQALPWWPRALQHPLWLEASPVLGADALGGLSLDPYATGTAAMRLLTYVGVFWLAMQVGRTPGRARRIIQALALAGLAYAAYGLLAFVLAPDGILWWRKWYWMHGVTSTFINRNHYATYAGLGLLCAVGLLVTTAHRERRAVQRGRRSMRHARLRTRARVAWLATAALVLALAVVMTGSRGGFASTAFALATLFVLFGLTHAMPARSVAASAAFAALLGGAVFALAGDDLEQRLAATDLPHEKRVTIYQRIGGAILDRPWLGTGYGTFEAGFQSYRSAQDRQRWDHAHNTYLEDAFELGIPAAAGLIAAIGWLTLRCARALTRRPRDTLCPSLGVAATVLVGLHALLDFSVEIPAIAVSYAALLGVASARARPVRTRRHSEPVAWRSRRQRGGIAAAALVGAVLLVLAVPRIGALLSALPVTLVQREMDAGRTPSAGALEHAIEAGRAAMRWSQDPRIIATVGAAELILAQPPDLPSDVRQRRLRRAEQTLRAALARAPANPVTWTQLAYAVLAQDGDPATINRALTLSVLTGPNQTTLMPLRSALAAAAWDRLDSRARRLFHAQLVQTMRISPRRLVEMLRRGEQADLVRAQLANQAELQAKFDRLLSIFGRYRPAS